MIRPIRVLSFLRMIGLAFLAGVAASPGKAQAKAGALSDATPERERQLRDLDYKKDWKGMEAHARDWIEKAPDNGTAWWCLGYALLMERRIPESRDASERATQLMPDMWRAWFNLGLAEKELGHFDKVHACYLKLLKINQDVAKQYRLNVMP